MKQAVSEGLAFVSTQVLQGFLVAVTRKLFILLPHQQAERAVRDLAKLPTAQIDADMIFKAIATMRRYRLSFWDSLIVQAALHGGATILYTQDLQHGQVIETLAIDNPFQA